MPKHQESSPLRSQASTPAQKKDRDIRSDDNQRYGRDSERGSHGHYNVQTDDRRASTDSDRQRGVENNGPDLISDFGTGEGGGHPEGRGGSHGHANEFYEDTDNERYREVRRNHFIRHGIDESDLRDRDDSPAGQTRAISAGLDKVAPRRPKASGIKNAKRRKVTAKKRAARSARKKTKAKKAGAKKTAKKQNKKVRKANKLSAKKSVKRASKR